MIEVVSNVVVDIVFEVANEAPKVDDNFSDVPGPTMRPRPLLSVHGYAQVNTGMYAYPIRSD